MSSTTSTPQMGIGVGVDRPPGVDTNGSSGEHPPLQGYDQVSQIPKNFLHFLSFLKLFFVLQNNYNPNEI
uniref:Uncharacterized protein n=1 Tax=Phlebotomus papatasi TaxID=29031 RepID=A0A1B0D2P1_PHLPP